MSDQTLQVLPLFPLPTLVYPGGLLPLQIFEPRYLRMVKDCLKHGSGFVVIQTVESEHSTQTASENTFYEVGCYCEISDWHPLPGDLLGLEARGLYKVRVHSHHAENDNLLIGQCELLPAELQAQTGEQHQLLKKLMQDVEKHPMIQMLGLDIDYDNASELGYRLAEFLPFSGPEKQLLLESDSAMARLDAIQSLIRELNGG
ncbi:MAG: LON peptidase substrate-binding domain-containing protein [Marinobacterium sp.]|nr:LON peptidase substrate-binding domain-containing protein [Marinobacterium sp.]